ncbi:hypothetical protein ACHAQE_010568 [Botrytis cinerea]
MVKTGNNGPQDCRSKTVISDITRQPGDHRRLSGFSLTPLKFPRYALSVTGTGNGSLVKVSPAIPNGENVHAAQLWFATHA